MRVTRYSISCAVNTADFVVSYYIRLHTRDGTPKIVVKDGGIVFFSTEEAAREEAKRIVKELNQRETDDNTNQEH